MSKVTEAIAEIDDKVAEYLPVQEGLKDYLSLDIQPNTKTAVTAAKLTYDTRINLLNVAKKALEDLEVNGHPDIAVQEVSPSVYDDLQEQERTISAALARIAAERAAALNATVAPPVLK